MSRSRANDPVAACADFLSRRLCGRGGFHLAGCVDAARLAGTPLTPWTSTNPIVGTICRARGNRAACWPSHPAAKLPPAWWTAGDGGELDGSGCGVAGEWAMPQRAAGRGRTLSARARRRRFAAGGAVHPHRCHAPLGRYAKRAAFPALRARRGFPALPERRRGQPPVGAGALRGVAGETISLRRPAKIRLPTRPPPIHPCLCPLAWSPNARAC